MAKPEPSGPVPSRPAAQHARRLRAGALGAGLAALAGCARGAARHSPAERALLGDRADRAEPVAPGVTLRRLAGAHPGDAAPWVAHVLDVALDSCWTFAARKAGGQAVGRLGTRALAGELVRGGEVVAGAVNADFFTFRPPGTTENAHVERGDVLLGPSDRPVFAVRADGRAWIGTLGVTGRAVVRGDTIALGAWNRGPSRGPAAAFAAGADRGVALYDARYGSRTDSMPGRLFVHLAPVPQAGARPGVAVVLAVDTGAAALLPAGGYVLAAGPAASPAVRGRLAGLRAGRDSVRLDVALVPHPVREAVGGWPVLVRGGQPVAALDTVGPAGFRARNPRTAIALAGDHRALLVVLDGRQPGISTGATLPELADLLRALGATEALNLDGGGSSTLVVSGGGAAAARAGDAAELRIVNRPSDPTGERPVGNALAVVRGCP